MDYECPRDIYRRAFAIGCNRPIHKGDLEPMNNKKIDDFKRKIGKLNYGQSLILEIVITSFLIQGWIKTIPAPWLEWPAKR